jgi:signal transduction histidine kinase
MKHKSRSLNLRMIAPREWAAITALITLVFGGLYFSIQDALQLEKALNLSLTQTVIVSQGIINLQREVQLTRNEVTRLLGKLDDPPQPITRFDFVQIQVNNLVAEVDTVPLQPIYTVEDLALVREVNVQSENMEKLLITWQQTAIPAERTAALQGMDAELQNMEITIKQLVDRQATSQRNAIIQTRDSLTASQRTAILAGVILLLMSLALAAVTRRVFASRLQQALEADQIKSQLLTNVSHELRTPLAAINGYSQLLAEEAYGPMTDEQNTTVKKILINTAQLQGMVNNLLDRAQIEQGKLILRKTSFSPADLIKTAHAALEILAKTKGLELTSEITPDVPARLIGDELRLQQILFNLTSNALKFTESGSVRAKISLPDPSHWSLQVSDTGIGIAADAQAHIFESFWQIDSSATRQYRGSGLGLAIVKQLVDLMNGTITLTSQPGKGSTFTILFPLEPNK